MKKIFATILILTLSIGLIGCGNGNSASTTSPASSDKPEVSESLDMPETSDPAQEDSPIEMGELAIVFGNDAFTLPISVEEFMALGWEPSREEQVANLEETLKPKEYTILYLEKGDYYAPSLVANLSEDEAITVSQGTIIGFDEVSYYNMLELPKGIVQGVSSMEDILAAYGEPDYVDSWGKYTSYYIEGFIVSVWEYEKSGLLGLVKIKSQDWENYGWIHF